MLITILFLSLIFFLCLAFPTPYNLPLYFGLLMVVFMVESTLPTLGILDRISTCFSVDEVGLFLSLLTFIIFFCIFIATSTYSNYPLIGMTLASLFYFCLQVFNTGSIFNLYFFYEASLVPIYLIIVKWGTYPERSQSAIVMLFYTLVLSAPFVPVIIHTYHTYHTFIFSLLSIDISPTSVIVSLVVFLTFAVKLPLYGLHQWLPMAHVEAPTFGSVLLASLLLKLGGVGLIRCTPLVNIGGMHVLVLGYLVVFSVVSFIVCCFQNDFNRLIAYSSVAHMIIVPILFISSNILSVQSLAIVMLFHGLSSAILFLIVGIVYDMFSTRQLILTRGIVLISPLICSILILTFFFTVSAPPFPSFLAEVFAMFASFILTSFLGPVFALIAFLGLVYNLNWLVSLCFGSPVSMSHEAALLNFFHFLPIMVLFYSTVGFSALLYLF